MPDLQILYADPVTGIMSFGMGRSPKTLTGLPLLAQVVALAILKNPSKDVLSPDEGSGIRALIGQYSLDSTEEIRLLIIQKVSLVEKQILSKQAAGAGIPNERLKKLTVLDVAIDPADHKVLVLVRVLSEAGDSTEILV